MDHAARTLIREWDPADRRGFDVDEAVARFLDHWEPRASRTAGQINRAADEAIRRAVTSGYGPVRRLVEELVEERVLDDIKNRVGPIVDAAEDMADQILRDRIAEQWGAGS